MQPREPAFDPLVARPASSPVRVIPPTRLGLVERGVLVTCLLGAAALTGWLFDVRSHWTSTPQAEPSVGQAAAVHQDVRRRAASGFAWESLTSGHPVFAGDTIFVGPRSSAQLVFDDAAALDLDASTLVSLEPGPSRHPSIRLVRGGLTARAGESDLTLVTERVEARLTAGGRARVGHGRDDEIEAQVAAGGLEIKSAGATTSVPPRHAVTIDFEGEVAPPTRLVAEPVRPHSGERMYYTGAPKPVMLVWRGGGETDLVVEVALDPTFVQIVAESANREEVETFVPQGPGPHWWRLVDPATGLTSEVRKFVVVAEQAPHPLLPSAGEVLLAPPGSPLRFAWVDTQADRYLVEVATHADFDAVLLRQEVQGHRTLLENTLPEGEYLWRVGARTQERTTSVFSRPRAFRVIHRPVIDAPELVGAEGVGGG